jgi:hypothetical protein
VPVGDDDDEDDEDDEAKEGSNSTGTVAVVKAVDNEDDVATHAGIEADVSVVGAVVVVGQVERV